MRHCKVMHGITLKEFSYYLNSARGFCKVTLRFAFQGLQNLVAVHENVKCQFQINEWNTGVGIPRRTLNTQLGSEMRREGCQLQRNIQLRASLFGAKIWNERFNVIANCVSRGVLSGDCDAQPPSRRLFHDSATLFSRHLFEQKCCCFNQQMCPNWRPTGLRNSSVTGVSVYF